MKVTYHNLDRFQWGTPAFEDEDGFGEFVLTQSLVDMCEVGHRVNQAKSVFLPVLGTQRTMLDVPFVVTSENKVTACGAGKFPRMASNNN